MNETKNDKKINVRAMVFTAIVAALICVASPFSIPMPGLVPISLGTFAIYLGSALLGGKRATVAVTVFILIGAVGLPVFTGFTGGFAKLLGVTGGYIIGYIPLAFITGIFAEKFNKLLFMPVGMILGTAALYTFGTIWFMIATGSGLGAALMSCVVPFLIGDGIKIAVATAVAKPVRARINGYMSGI
ncbi:MAG: biotin transporter BioY [Oscillospiraceae bacterium]|nr:biotin transporter BioY [Oscillospiraceae bacterium]